MSNDNKDNKDKNIIQITEIKETITEPLEINETQNAQLHKMDVDDISETLQMDKINVLEKNETMEQD